MGADKTENQSNVPPKQPAKTYGKIVLSLKNCLLPDEKLMPTPSQVDGLEHETEIDLRILGCEMIQTAGILLKLPQVAMATGQVLFQRFYYSKSFVRHAMDTSAMGCVCLASKIEEAPRRIRDVINVFQHIKQVKGQKTIFPMILDQAYTALKSQIIKAERRVLKELGFCVHVKHPHKLIVMYLQVLGCEKNAVLMQLAWNYMNDALRTDVFVRYHPETVACACIYLTARKLGVSLPKAPAWFSIFKVTEEDIHDVCYRILRLYARPKPNAEDLERKVEDLRRHYQDARMKARGNSNQSGTNTPARTPSPATNHTSGKSPEKKKEKHTLSPRWGGFISRSNNHIEKHRSKSRSPTQSKHSKKSKKSRQRSHSRSRSRDVDRKSKKSSGHHKRRKASSRSPSVSPPHRHSRKISREKVRYRSRSRSPKRSGGYDRYERIHC